ncbi:DUF488 family protein [Paraburkholderia dinghuensis]|uniref:DUF488 family protein n=2 Tax=Paraburkholderia dinghuensis TaxID=2305225 RepID=A0A3N6NRQ8_9BURK|nr:DUF488 family protein [Paraburkholderia dinghuensis]
MPSTQTLPHLLAEIRACRVCADALPLGPRPVVQAGSHARLLIVGQAPGAKVHASGVPWDDVSGERLRAWLGIDRETFYDASKVALVPMGFCYPGRGASGDNPPRPECAPRWHARLLAQLPDVRLTLLVGQYAQRHFLGERRRGSLTETVKAWRDYAPDYLPLPHPSPRNLPWLMRHAWFEHDVLPALRERVAVALAAPAAPATTRQRAARRHKGDPEMSKPTIDIQRVYEPPPTGDHACFLVDRLWPRGIRKEALAQVEWLKDAAPSAALRQWYHKDLSQWDEFGQRYVAELDANPATWAPLAQACENGPVALLYGSRDAEHNHAIVLRDYLIRKLKRK